MDHSISALFIASVVLALPIVYKTLQVCLVFLLARWKNREGKLMPGELPKLPFGDFSQVNFFGRELSKKHGPVYYIWNCLTPVVILSDAKAIRSFYTDHYSHIREADMFCLGAVFESIFGRCMATSHGRDEVKRCRGPFEKYFSASSTVNHMNVIGRECKDFIHTLKPGQAINLKTSRMEDVTLRVIVHLVYGGEVLEKYFHKIIELQSMLEDAVADISHGTTRLPLYKKVKSTTNSKVKRFNEAWAAFNHDLFALYEKGKLTGKDGFFFDSMALLKGNALGIDEEEFLQSLDEILLLNIDVSFAATSFAIADLAKYQDIQIKLRDEVDNQLKGLEPSSFENLEKKLPFMEMVLKESARMHPALALSLPEKTKKTTDLAGFIVPKGTTVCVDPFSLNYSETYWDNPDVFDPERFAAGKNPVPGSFFRFGLGPRKCLGYRIALAITRIVVASFIQRYEIQLFDKNSFAHVKSTGMLFFTPYLSPDIILKCR